MTLVELKDWIDKECDKARLDKGVTVQEYHIWLQVQQKVRSTVAESILR